MVLGAKVTTHVKTLLGHIKGHLGSGIVNRVSSTVGSRTVMELLTNICYQNSKKVEPQHHELVKRLSALGGSTDELANTILALMVGSTVELSLGVSSPSY
jgi:linoleate 10R-lipoxygenase